MGYYLQRYRSRPPSGVSAEVFTRDLAARLGQHPALGPFVDLAPSTDGEFVLRAHPGSEFLEIAERDGVLSLRVKTSSVGAGYHAWLVDASQEAATSLGFSWDRGNDPYADEGDFARLSEAMVEDMRNVTRMLSFEEDETTLSTRSISTWRGELSSRHLAQTLSAVGEDLDDWVRFEFSWPERVEDGRFWRSTALHALSEIGNPEQSVKALDIARRCNAELRRLSGPDPEVDNWLQLADDPVAFGKRRKAWLGHFWSLILGEECWIRLLDDDMNYIDTDSGKFFITAIGSDAEHSKHYREFFAKDYEISEQCDGYDVAVAAPFLGERKRVQVQGKVTKGDAVLFVSGFPTDAKTASSWLHGALRTARFRDF